MAEIHPSAIISSGAKIGEGVSVGPYAWIQDDVEIGDGTSIGAGSIICEGTRIGRDCKIFHHAVIGEVPQDLKFAGEKTYAIIGDRTVIREFVTINRGTQDRWKTEIGSDCLIMATAHVAHDCLIGNHVIIANGTAVAGHVEIEDWVRLGGLTGIHQFVKVGAYSMLGGGFRTTKDIPPFVIAAGEPVRYTGLNIVGLKRLEFTGDVLKAIKDAYHLILKSEYNVSDAVRELESQPEIIPEVRQIIDFIKKSERGIIR